MSNFENILVNYFDNNKKRYKSLMTSDLVISKTKELFFPGVFGKNVNIAKKIRDYNGTILFGLKSGVVIYNDSFSVIFGPDPRTKDLFLQNFSLGKEFKDSESFLERHKIEITENKITHSPGWSNYSDSLKISNEESIILQEILQNIYS